MRFDGLIKTWNDERGFGFITPLQDEPEIFFHIKAFFNRGARPEVGQAVSFEVELDRDGKKRATSVKPLRTTAPFRKRRKVAPAQWATASRVAFWAFLVLYPVAFFQWEIPAWVAVAGVYVGASILAFANYASDKSAAVAHAWRVSETKLLLIGLAGGWPGAIVAQQVLRHKSNKRSFLTVFWATVVVNVTVLITLASPFGQLLLGR